MNTSPPPLKSALKTTTVSPEPNPSITSLKGSLANGRQLEGATSTADARSLRMQKCLFGVFLFLGFVALAMVFGLLMIFVVGDGS